MTEAAEGAGQCELVRTVIVPALLAIAEARAGGNSNGASAPRGRRAAGRSAGAPPARLEATIVAPLTAEARAAPARAAGRGPGRLGRCGRHAARGAALRDGAVAAGAVAGEWLVGVALAAPAEPRGASRFRLVALGVAPEWRERGLAHGPARGAARGMLTGELPAGAGSGLVALHTVAERDPVDPLARAVRREWPSGCSAAPASPAPLASARGRLPRPMGKLAALRSRTRAPSPGAARARARARLATALAEACPPRPHPSAGRGPASIPPG